MVKPMSHEEARQNVCAICTNNHGTKAHRKVNPNEVEFISREIIQGYSETNLFLPSGICKRCIFDVNQKEKGNQLISFSLNLMIVEWKGKQGPVVWSVHVSGVNLQS